MKLDWGILVGLVAIAAAIFFGLHGFRKDIGDKLGEIRDKIVAMEVTLDKAWDLLKIHFGAATGTVVRELKNIGTTKISAKPGGETTTYVIETEKPILNDDFIVKLSKTSTLEVEERRLFDNNLPKVSTSLPTRLTIIVPCTEPKKCAEYISIFLKWLDSTYYEALPDIKKYEEPIQI